MGTAVDFGATRRQAEQDGQLGGGGFFKLKEGDNRIRLMSECLPHTSDFNGTKNFKWLCYVIDRTDGEVRAFFMAHKIYKAIEALQLNPDYAFTEVPMPYDLTIHAKKAGTKEVEYSLIPARRETPLTEDEREKLDAAKPLAELKQVLKEKQSKAAEQDQRRPQDEAPAATTPLSADEIPF